MIRWLFHCSGFRYASVALRNRREVTTHLVNGRSWRGELHEPAIPQSSV
jgi:hypothetical protein